MNCFNHTEVAAVGICKSCYKGLCPECAIELTDGIACANSCASKVEELNTAIEQNKALHKNFDSEAGSLFNQKI